jgi:hypothetical protein
MQRPPLTRFLSRRRKGLVCPTEADIHPVVTRLTSLPGALARRASTCVDATSRPPARTVGLWPSVEDFSLVREFIISRLTANQFQGYSSHHPAEPKRPLTQRERSFGPDQRTRETNVTRVHPGRSSQCKADSTKITGETWGFIKLDTTSRFFAPKITRCRG